MDENRKQQYIQELKELRSELLSHYRNNGEGDNGEGESTPESSSNIAMVNLKRAYSNQTDSSSYSSDMLRDMRRTISSQYMRQEPAETDEQATQYGQGQSSEGIDSGMGRSR